MKNLLILLPFLLFSSASFAQQAQILGRVFDAKNNEPLAFATVAVVNTNLGTITDEQGHYKIEGLKNGVYNIAASYLGYEKEICYEIRVVQNKSTVLDFGLSENASESKEIVITPALFRNAPETPVSSRSLGAQEIERAPGGGRDISRVVNVLPGVASPAASSRNDLIIRGGSPSENRFYVDGFEVGTINHFTTQGSSGGVWGVLDANMVHQMNVMTGAFPTYAGQALSAVFDIDLKEGNRENTELQINTGIIQSGVNASGALADNITYLAGARVADFNLLFSSRPIIPTFYDMVAKLSVDLDAKNRIQGFAIGSLDKMKINTAISERNDENLHTLESVRKIDQTNYTAGINWRHFWSSGFSKLYVYQTSLTNDILKYQDNDPSKLKIMDYTSQESAFKLRVENTFTSNGFEYSFGGAFELGHYSVNSEHYRVNQNGYEFIDFNSSMSLKKYAAFASLTKRLFNDRFTVNVGTRIDANDYSKEFSNPLAQFSPRVNLSYQLTSSMKASFNSGLYYQNPSYPMMGYTVEGELVNQEKLKPIKSLHVIGGLEYLTYFNSSISLEGFYKRYTRYPFSVSDGISMANKGAGFGVFGSEEILSISKGRSYGVEFLYQQKLLNGFYGILSYTFVKSEFDSGNDQYAPSSWDYGNILNAAIGKRFKNNWELGVKFLFNSGAPYTPYDIDASSKIENWNRRGSGVLNYSQLNSKRAEPFYELDVRVDKKFFFEKWRLTLYVDVRNILNYQGGSVPELILERDSEGNPVVDSASPDSYKTKLVTLNSFGRQPNIGLIIEF